jgi:hypothetical protein
MLTRRRIDSPRGASTTKTKDCPCTRSALIRAEGKGQTSGGKPACFGQGLHVARRRVCKRAVKTIPNGRKGAAVSGPSAKAYRSRHAWLVVRYGHAAKPASIAFAQTQNDNF